MPVDEPRSDRGRGPRGPRTVMLCGSVRFRADFERVAAELTRAGCTVLAPTFPASGVELDAAERARLGRAHLARVAAADEVLVVDVGGHVGESTRREVALAQSRGVPVRFLEAPRDGSHPSDGHRSSP